MDEMDLLKEYLTVANDDDSDNDDSNSGHNSDSLTPIIQTKPCILPDVPCSPEFSLTRNDAAQTIISVANTSTRRPEKERVLAS